MLLVGGNVDPEGVVGVGREAGAADLADGVVGEDLDGVGKGADAVSLEGLHVEDVNTLDLAHELETLNTGGLLLAVRVSVSPQLDVAPIRSEPPLCDSESNYSTRPRPPFHLLRSVFCSRRRRTRRECTHSVGTCPAETPGPLEEVSMQHVEGPLSIVEDVHELGRLGAAEADGGEGESASRGADGEGGAGDGLGGAERAEEGDHDDGVGMSGELSLMKLESGGPAARR